MASNRSASHFELKLQSTTGEPGSTITMSGLTAEGLGSAPSAGEATTAPDWSSCWKSGRSVLGAGSSGPAGKLMSASVAKAGVPNKLATTVNASALLRDSSSLG